MTGTFDELFQKAKLAQDKESQAFKETLAVVNNMVVDPDVLELINYTANSENCYPVYTHS